VLNYETFCVTDLFADVLIAVGPLLSHTHQSLQFSGSQCRLLADRALLCQVLVNLILTSSTCSPMRGEVCVEFARRSEEMWIEVEPAGRGLGSGLAVVRAIVEAHGGRVGAANRRHGGAGFWITLPNASGRARHIAGAAIAS
jgi:K+-sensing histidine kinase KdpD